VLLCPEVLGANRVACHTGAGESACGEQPTALYQRENKPEGWSPHVQASAVVMTSGVLYAAVSGARSAGLIVSKREPMCLMWPLCITRHG
jgi:hypothetical protein